MDPLQHLGQQERIKSLKMARGILIFVGDVTLALNGFFLANADKEVDDEVRKVSQGGSFIVDEVEVEKVRKQVKFMYGAGAVLGAIFIVLGVMVMSYPVPCTVSGLVLYIGAAAGFAMISPESLLQGIIIKILIVVGLVKSVQAAIAYQRQEREGAAAGTGVSGLS